MATIQEENQNTVIKSLLTRRSIRQYDENKVVPREYIQTIIHTASYAPSFENRQPWNFIVITYDHIISFLRDAFQNDFPIRAKTLVIVCTDTIRDNQMGWWIQDCSAATQNILLASHGLGLVSNWYGIHPVKHRKRIIKKIFRLPKRIQPFSLVTIGFPMPGQNLNENVPERFIEDKIHFNKW